MGPRAKRASPGLRAPGVGASVGQLQHAKSRPSVVAEALEYPTAQALGVGNLHRAIERRVWNLEPLFAMREAHRSQRDIDHQRLDTELRRMVAEPARDALGRVIGHDALFVLGDELLTGTDTQREVIHQAFGELYDGSPRFERIQRAIGPAGPGLDR